MLAAAEELHISQPEEKDVFCQRFLEEQLYVTLPKSHPLTERKSVLFSDLAGSRFLVNGNVGFWMEICRKHFEPSHLLVQSSVEAMGELVEASSLPFFNSDRMLERGYDHPERVSLPIEDADAHATYYIACLSNEKGRFGTVFSAVREAVLRNR